MNIYRVTFFQREHSNNRIFLKVVAWNVKAAKTIGINHIQNKYPYANWVLMYASKIRELEASPRYQGTISERVRLK